tara:strand:- start:396 stop:602 length:207 start_codon:yes stop_codon:yes gene_type:complete
MKYKLNLVKGNKGVFEEVGSNPKREKFNVNLSFTKEDMARMKKRAGLVGKDYSNNAVIKAFLTQSLYG